MPPIAVFINIIAGLAFICKISGNIMIK